ncbi:MAG: hypothetical protein OIF48_13415 [Silicimonas sp.]|nr:hypothetical protein [Silicimonas sp.]
MANGVVLAGSPFAAPYRDRTEAELSVALDRALRREMSPELIAARINEALDAGEVDEASALLRLADGRGVAVSVEMRATVLRAEEKAEGWSACLACAISAEDCRDLTRVATCNLPLELTPVGDVKAITRALTDYLAGSEIDRVDLALGVVGLSATLAILVSGGSSATVKLGATTLRVARKTGAISARLMGEITTLASSALRLDRAGDVARGAAPLSDLIDAARAAKLTALAGDMGRIADALPPGEALAMLRLADSAPELTRIARVAETAGAETRGTFAVLGKSRVMRVAQRLTEAALLALTLLAALAAQLLTLILWLIRRALAGQSRRPRPRYAKD